MTNSKFYWNVSKWMKGKMIIDSEHENIGKLIVCLINS